jgi:signal transduction histidine kinase
MPDVALRERELLNRLGWFIRVRWAFLAGLVVAIAAGKYVFGVEFPVARAALVGALVLSYNVLFFVYHRYMRPGTTPDLATSSIEAGVQIGLDLLALTSLIHLVGGAENPFVCFYLFHAIVGSMLLSRRAAWLVGLAAFGLFLLVVVLEYQGLLPHHHVTGLSDVSRHRHAPFLIVVCLSFLATLFSTIWITSSIVNSLRVGEKQLVLTREALVRKSQDLEQANARLTEKQKQLVETEKQASLGQLVAGIAHEINNPIQFIHGNMGIISEAFTDVLPLLDERHAARPLRVARLDYPFFRSRLPVLLSDMADGAARIEAIVRDLKTFARRDAGRLDEDVDLNAAAQASLRLLHSQLKRFEVEEDLDPALPRIRGNLTQLQQVLVNTLQNAAEALGHDPKGVIRVTTRPAHDGRVRLSISDNGPGIAPEVKGRIFDPFFTTKQRSGGTGLGLAITYGIVQQHHGLIEVETEVGRGTTFHLDLPVAWKDA